MEGNSIYEGIVVSTSTSSKRNISFLYTKIRSGMGRRMEAVGKRMLNTHKAFVFSEQYGDSSVDLADSQ